ncbi:MAG: PAS domain S-box protein [Burkholderiales bacterium]
MLTQPIDTNDTGALLERLAGIGLSLTGTLELDDVFRALRLQSAALLDASSFMLWWREGDSPTLVLRFGDELGRSLPQTRVSLNDPGSNAARCARERSEVVISLKSGDVSSQHMSGTQVMLSALFGALVVGDRVMGVLSVQSPCENAYGATQRHIFRTLCAFGAIGINNAHAYSRLEDTRKALVSLHAQYRDVIEHVSEAICIYQDGHVVLCNSKACQMTGFEHDQLIGKTIEETTMAEDLEGTANWIRAHFRGEAVARYHRLRGVRRDGGFFWTEASMGVVSWNGRRAAVAVFADLTERMAAEQAVRHSEERYRTLVNHATDGILVVQDSSVVFANPRAEAITRGELTGERAVDFFDRVHRNDRPIVLGHFHRLLEGGLGNSYSGREPFRLIDLEGHQRWLESAAVCIEWEGRPAALAFVIDVTERRSLEQKVRLSLQEAVQAKEAADAASRAKSEFLAMMSHEIRTPIAGVIGMQSFALRDANLSPKTRQQLELAHSNAQSLLTLLNDVLDLSKIEAGKLDVESIHFNLHALLHDALSLLGERAANKSIILNMHLDPGVPVHVMGDPTRIRQVLVNLLGNAVKFTEAGSVSLHVRYLAREGTSTRLDFEVRDTGIGMDAGALSRLFQKFEQADTSTTRRYGGTGLGLAITRQLVSLMGGDIHVESALGQGSTFHVNLLLPDGHADAQTQAAPRQPHEACLRVLCAEDFPTNQIIIRTLLEDSGHEVEVVDNGRLALQALHERRFDLVLMDGRMPEMDGSTATRWIRAGGQPDAPIAQRDIPIVALTANASEEDRQHYLACGMDDFVAKPINEEALHDTLTRVITTLQARGVTLAPVRSTPTVAALDALFGLEAEAPLAPSPPKPLAEVGRPPQAQRQERLRQAYAQDLPERITSLERALKARDAEAASLLLHGLKGSTGFLAREGPAHALCSTSELATLSGDWQRLEADWPELRAALTALASPP